MPQPRGRYRRPAYTAGLRDLVAGTPRLLLLVLAAGVALRVFEMVVYSTVTTTYYTGDAGRFMRHGFDGMFSDGWQPAGYPLFLAGTRSITNALSVTVGLQHLFGLAMAVLLFATARRAGASTALAVIPTAWVALSGDHLFMEQTLLTESLWMVLLAASLYAGTRAAQDRDLRWLAAASTLLGISVVVRNVSMPLPAVLAAWALVVWRPPLRASARVAAAAIAPAAITILTYMVIATSVGQYSGLGEMSGWSLYQRVGQFADCTRFTPPDGTAGLCDSRPTGEREGPFYYYFSLESPARKAFPAMAVEDSSKVGEFARAAIIHQPLDYARTVTKDVIRYFDPGFGFRRELSGSDPSAMTFQAAPGDPVFAARVEDQYTGFDATPDRGSSLLVSYQAVFRLVPLALLALLALAAIALARGSRLSREVGALVGLTSAVLLVVPPALSSYDARYAIPPAALLTVSAALALTALTQRPLHGQSAR